MCSCRTYVRHDRLPRSSPGSSCGQRCGSGRGSQSSRRRSRPSRGPSRCSGRSPPSAEAAGVRPGMRLGEALAMCPSLALVDQDPAAAEEAWEAILRRLEDAGFSQSSRQTPGCAYFETRGVERLYGGLEPALKRALDGGRRRAGTRASARPSGASPRSPRRTSRGRVRRWSSPTSGRAEFLAPLAADAAAARGTAAARSLRSWACKRLGELAGLPGGAVAERLGPDGRRAWSLARGGSSAAASAGGSPPRSSSSRSSSRRRSGTS